MTIRCQKLIEKIETAILKYPDFQRKLVGTLLLFLRIRNSSAYEGDLNCMIESARVMQKDPRMESDSDMIFCIVEIVSEFPKLTKPETTDIDDYLLSLFAKFGTSLANYLEVHLGGKVDVFFKTEKPIEFKTERLLINFATEKLYNDEIVEDFHIDISSDIKRAEVIRLIRSYFEPKGFEMVRELDDLGIMFYKPGTEVIVCITITSDQIFVTVNLFKI